MLSKLIAFHHEVMRKNYLSIGYKKDGEAPLVSVIVRSGGRSKDMVLKTLKSLADQTYKRIELILVLYKKIKNCSNLQNLWKIVLKN